MKQKILILSIFITAIHFNTIAQKNSNSPAQVDSDKKRLLYSWTFSESNPLHDLAELTPDVTVVEDPLDPSNKVMQCVLPNGEYRTEASVGAKSPHYFYADSIDSAHGDEIWVGFRLLKFNEPFSGTNTNVSIFQIGPVHNIYFPKNGKGHYQLRLSTTTDKWKLREFESMCDPNTCNDDISAVNYGQWDRFVFHCKFKSDNTGVFEIWRNDVKIYSATRQNGVKNARTRVKWGIYLGAGNTEHETLKCYFDDVKIGGSNANYDVVVPR